ncbi:MAG TPA: hypothetical protein VFQ45_11830 [Longimicrobium sp.]|nr:hypothetical protein [Longimicrobium sp.]
MPSLALQTWQTESAAVLDELEAAHVAVGTGTRGRRFATRPINQAYTLLLASQFQRFCRDLHNECVERLIAAVQPALLPIVRARFVEGRKLDVGNANPGNIGSDFSRLGMRFWPSIIAADRRTPDRQKKLDALIRWRNAVAHQNFSAPEIGGRTFVTLGENRAWRAACNSLAVDFDRALRAYLTQVTEAAPW